MPTQTDAVSTVYARSLFELAEAAGADKVKEIAEELNELVELTRSDDAFGRFLSSPVVDAERRKASLRKILDGQVTDLTLRFVLLLNDKGRLGHFESIVGAYDTMVDEAHGRVEVDLWTAAPMGDEQLATVTSRIREAIGKEPIVHAHTDEGMMGGVKLRIGDQLIDGSLATRLRRMKEDLTSTGAATMRERMNVIVEGGETGA